MGILLGYAEVGYRILINNKIIVARRVKFVEKDVKYIGLDDEIPAKSNMEQVEYNENANNDGLENNIKNIHENDSEKSDNSDKSDK